MRLWDAAAGRATSRSGNLYEKEYL